MVRPEWVPISAASLVTGVMALALGQALNPGGSDSSPAAQMMVAAEYPGRWMAMSILFFGGAAAMVLGMPAVMTLFQVRRGRALGMAGVATFTVGCLGIAALAGLMLMFRALALETLDAKTVVISEVSVMSAALQDTGLAISLAVWVYTFLVGVLLIAVGLFRSRTTPAWVPSLLVMFLVMQATGPLLGHGTGAHVAATLALILLAAGFTGMATQAASPRGAGAFGHAPA